MAPTKIALVTGGNRGIGRSTAIALARGGYEVLITSRSSDAAAAAFADVPARLRPARILPADLTVEADRRAVAAELGSRGGGLDLLINNAGAWLESENASVELANNTSGVELPLLRSTFEINFFAPVHLTQLLLPLLSRSEAGRIVNIASMHASLTLQATPGSPVYDRKAFAYASSKTALNAFTIPLAHELAGTAVTVNSLDPGWVRSRMGGPDATLSPDECGAAIAALVTRLGPDVTGRFLTLELGVERPW